MMNSTFKKKAWIVLLPVGIVLVAVGIMQDGYYDTLSKAITVCLECIGIG